MKNFLLLFLFLFVWNINAQELPNITLKSLDGKSVTTQEISNSENLKVLSFWATWCVPCINELDAISEVYEEWQDETNVEIIGHTDNVGGQDYNQKLSTQRAESVSSILAQNDVSRSRIKAYGRGEIEPMMSNNTSKGRASNRRVEIMITPLIDQNAKWIKTIRDDNVFSLNYEDYKAKLERNEEEAKRFESLSDYKTNLTFSSLPYEIALMEKDSVLKIKRNRWHEDLSKDIYMEEALNVLNDLKMTYAVKNKVANVKN